MTELDGRTALVTGAERGIARSCARALAEAGADVVLVGRSPRDLEGVAEEIRALGRRARPVALDLTDAKSVRHLALGLPELDVAVVAAGATVSERFLEVTEERLDALLATHVRASFVTVQAAARRMTELGGGSIVLLSSHMGHVGAAGRTVYYTSKYAIEGLTRAAAVELAPRGIRVNAVAPVSLETSTTQAFLVDATSRSDVESHTPRSRFTWEEEVGAGVVFLASDAAALVTGTSLPIGVGQPSQ